MVDVIAPFVAGADAPANGRFPGTKRQQKLCKNCKKLVYYEQEKYYELESNADMWDGNLGCDGVQRH